ncbi:hypothetical protein [Lignipirellula cremea]|uniref:Uncharacterized protein n=1 Tax=Lignipirellula cremea TaxID=2528010 RepID=A0A518DYL3_9BACT|nr:hypothetical protein [Lignipirellula cremea]QDU96891.1 hypothetical protein Pla8534_47130 [Lignipirellula cremea]
MSKGNKAHSVTGRRIARNFQLAFNEQEGEVDFETDELVIEVETTATLQDGIERLKTFEQKKAFVAVTNQDALREALALVQGLSIGVINAQGEIVKQAATPAHND